MTIEEQVAAALSPLVGGQVFPDVAPEKTQAPYITYQAVGGAPLNYITGEDPGRANTRMQVNVWAATRIDASQLGVQVEAAIRAAGDLQPEVLTGRVSTYDPEKKLRGTMQDFSLWW